MIGTRAWKAVFATCLSLFYILNTVHAQLEVTAEVSPSTVWLHKENPSLSVFVECRINGTTQDGTVISGTIYYPDSTPMGSLGPTEAAAYNYSFYLGSDYQVGEYRVDVECEYGNYTNSTTKRFETKRLSLEIIDTDQKEVYKGGELEFDAVFKKYDKNHVDGEVIVPSQDTFSVYLVDGSEVQLDLISSIMVGDKQRIRASIPFSGPPEEGIYSLKLIGKDPESGEKSLPAVKQNFVKVNRALRMSVDDHVKCSAGTSCKKNILAHITYYAGSLDDFSTNNFDAVVMPANKPASIESVTCSESSKTCSLSVLMPTLDPGTYTLGITARANDHEDTVWIPLDVLLFIDGRILDASGGVVSATFSFEGNGTLVKSSTDALGKYSLSVLPGYYDAELKFPGVTVEFSHVRITEETVSGFGGDMIRYDSFIGSTGVEGIKVAKIVVLEFALPFEQAVVRIPYDDSKVFDETELEVYACHKWNFGARRCVGEWKKIESNIYTVRNMIEFNTTKLSAFIVGERKFLYFYTLDVSKEEINMGETVSVSGKILDSDGNPVNNARVSISLPEAGKKTSTVTMKDGIFHGTITTPYKEGIFNLIITVEKDPYIPGNESRALRVKKSKQISLILPEVADAFIDKPSDVEFSILNSGQTNLSDVRISISGIPAEWYELSPARIDKLGRSEEKKVVMRLTFTSEDCGDKCDQYHLVTVNVKAKTESGEELSKGGSFTLKFSLPPESSDESKRTFSRFPTINFPSITGLVTMPNVSRNTWLTLSLILMVGFAILWKKTRRSQVNKLPRSRISSRMKRIKLEIRKQYRK